jgi:hypothetical protein
MLEGRLAKAILVGVFSLSAGCLPDYAGDPAAADPQPPPPATGDPGVGGGGAPDLASPVGAPQPDLASAPATGSDGGAPATGSDGGAPATDPDGGALPAADLGVQCIKITTPLTSGHHNPGAACLDCHTGGGATLFTAGGTLYNTVTGGTAIAGATIRLTDAAGKVVDIVTSTNGNFYTSTAMTFPVTARASGCPNDVSMSSKATGNCNMSGCHTSTFRVHLP